ncbi:LUD domain-containing protein [Haloarcula nitratireducens]|uniref:LUD domain-containing protein n=1 Tax=Haloarcula nitratireducens TaxID=2487749 RepID=A0AAW4PEV6_9EURY|nr:LUD domain-containing protein [Halomicroarcula nitratireducens]MBX0296188.1 LUD domain-containing protein [Halomicroarcula nitratireducens]
MATTGSSFENALRELGVSVTHADSDTVREQIEETVTAPAVGVPLEATFGDAAFSLAETSVEVDPTPATLRDATTGVTGAQLGVADYGTLVLSLTERASELVSLFVERHVAVVRAADVVEEMETAIEELDEEFSETRGSAILATGPSATADMGALVKGAHGPKEVHVVLVEGGE